MKPSSLPPLLLILGPTGSGKSRLGLEVAELLDGEIVSADAFAVYRGLDIGTDKPAPKDQRQIRHHLIDVADPRQRFSAGQFIEQAKAAIDDIADRGRTPIVVGGTHFYIRALLVGLFPAPPRDPEISARLADEWTRDSAAVFRSLEESDPAAAEKIGPNDRQRVLRALEVFEATGEPLSSHWERHQPLPTFDPLLTAPRRSRPDLYARIDARVDSMFASGMVEEVRGIMASGVPVNAHALKAIGYREVLDVLQGRCNLETAIDNTRQSSRRFAKRQLTWLRGVHEGALHWVPPAEEGGAPAVANLWDQHTEGRRLK